MYSTILRAWNATRQSGKCWSCVLLDGRLLLVIITMLISHLAQSSLADCESQSVWFSTISHRPFHTMSLKRALLVPLFWHCRDIRIQFWCHPSHFVYFFIFSISTGKRLLWNIEIVVARSCGYFCLLLGLNPLAKILNKHKHKRIGCLWQFDSETESESEWIR